MIYRNQHTVYIFGAAVLLDIEAEYDYSVASFGTREEPASGSVDLREVGGKINGELVRFETWPASLAEEIIESIHKSPKGEE